MRNALKICLITTAFPRWLNDGRAAFILETAKALGRLGNQVKVIAMHNPGVMCREYLEGIEVVRPRYLPARWEILQSDSAGLPEVWRNNHWSRFAIIPFLIVHTISVAILAKDCDVIHANWTLSAASAWVTQWLHRRPFVVTVQGSDIFKAAKPWLFRKITSIVLSHAAQVFCLSRSLAEEVIQLGIFQEKISVIPNGVDLRKFSYDPLAHRDPIILFVGSLIERKGVGHLLTAFKMLNEDFPDYSLVFVGEGNLKESLERVANEQGLGKRVKFAGFQTQEEVHEWMIRARVLVLPSIEEGQGVVLAEALASGTPCVGSDIGGIKDVITPNVGKLVPPGEPVELFRAISEIIKCDYWNEISKQARKRAESEYNLDEIAKKINSTYQKILKTKELTGTNHHVLD